MLKRLPEEKRHIKQPVPQFDKKASRVFRREKRADPVHQAITAQQEANTEAVKGGTAMVAKKIKPEPVRKKEEPVRKTFKDEEKMPDNHKEYIVQNHADRITRNPLFYVTPKKPMEKMSRKNIYPVYAIETMPVKAVPQEDMPDSMHDSDDEEVAEERAEKQASVMLTVVWLLVGIDRTNELTWVDSSEVYYL